MTEKDFEAIRRLIAIYGQLLDSKRIEEWGQLFTPEAEFRVWGNTYRGRSEIVREIGGMQPDRPGKHVILQPVIDSSGADTARAWTDLCGTTTEIRASVTIFRQTADCSGQGARIGRWHGHTNLLFAHQLRKIAGRFNAHQ